VTVALNPVVVCQKCKEEHHPEFSAWPNGHGRYGAWVKQARDSAKKAGWKVGAKGDYCPECHSGGAQP
jgi:hypothetical protein